VNKEELKYSLDQIKPSETAKKRMLENILNHNENKKEVPMASFSYKKVVPVLALSAVLVGGMYTYKFLNQNNNHHGNSQDYLVTDDLVTDELDTGREDAVAPLLNFFRIDDKNYSLLYDELREEYGLPSHVKESDIGEEITAITISPDESLIGSKVYQYLPAGSDAIVAVKKGEEYQLFRFFTFESYNNNQDEDALRYLEIYGIDKADDIKTIEFISHSEESKLQGRVDIIGKLTDREEIAIFYNYYSQLKNSSDKYFDRLFNFNNSSFNQGVEIDNLTPNQAIQDKVAPDQVVLDNPEPVKNATDAVAPDKMDTVSNETSVSNSGWDTPSSSQGMMDMGDGVSGSVEPSQGFAGNALANPITIRIYNQNGIYYDSVYYENIGFINRYEISKDFVDFINDSIEK